MKKIVLRTTLAASLLAALSASAVGQAPAVPPAPAAPAAPPAPSPAMLAIQAMLRELQRPDDITLPATVRMERMAAQRLSPATAEQLRAVFGTDRLYTIERQPLRPGQVDWRLAIPALRHAPAQGTAYDWSAGRLDFRFNPAGTTAVLDGSWDTLAIEDATSRVVVRGMTLASRQKRGADKLWYGDARLAIGAIDIQGKADGVSAELTGLGANATVTGRGKVADIAYEGRIGRIAVAGEQVDDLRLALRMVNVDKATMRALSEAGLRQDNALDMLTPQQQLDALKPLLRSVGKAALARGTAVEIDEIGARYHGVKAALKGRIAVRGGTAADLDDMKALARKIVARFEVRIPVALVREISGTIAAKQAAQQGKPDDPQAIAQLRQSMTDVVVGKLLGGGFARMDGDVLVSVVEWRNGALFANGKPVPLPTPQPPGAAQAPVAPGPRGQDVLQARRIDGSCAMPDYPDDVVAGDLPLDVMFGFVVSADGKVAAPTVARASRFPDYDRAALAALAQCRYVPALRRGKPFDLATTWRLVRAPGTARP